MRYVFAHRLRIEKALDPQQYRLVLGIWPYTAWGAEARELLSWCTRSEWTTANCTVIGQFFRPAQNLRPRAWVVRTIDSQGRPKERHAAAGRRQKAWGEE